MAPTARLTHHKGFRRVSAGRLVASGVAGALACSLAVLVAVAASTAAIGRTKSALWNFLRFDSFVTPGTPGALKARRNSHPPIMRRATRTSSYRSPTGCDSWPLVIENLTEIPAIGPRAECPAR